MLEIRRIKTDRFRTAAFWIEKRDNEYIAYDHSGFEAKNRNARSHCPRWWDRPALRGCARW